MCIYIYIYICIRTHTHIHMYTKAGAVRLLSQPPEGRRPAQAPIFNGFLLYCRISLYIRWPPCMLQGFPCIFKGFLVSNTFLMR